MPFQKAIELYRGISGTEDFFEEWQMEENLRRAIFVNKQLGERLAAFDAHLLKASFCMPSSNAEMLYRVSARGKRRSKRNPKNGFVDWWVRMEGHVTCASLLRGS